MSEDQKPQAPKYRVIAENGLFKNGVQYDKGEVVTAGKELAYAAVAPFVEAGDIEPLEGAEDASV